MAQGEWLTQVESATLLLDAWFNRYDELIAPTLLLDGREIMALLNIRQGRQVGMLLDALREAQATRRVTTKAEAEALVKRAQASAKA